VVWPNGSNSIPTVSSEFNLNRRNPVTGVVQPHWGIDIVGFDIVRAPFAGTIIYAGYNGGYGNQVQIRRDNGDVVSMAHNRAFIRTGGRVSEGEGVAYMGTTGQSTGVHSHYETRPGGGGAINPRDYMAGNGGGGGPANVAAGQRTAGPGGVRRRSAPSSQSPEAGEMLSPGTVGNFTGWISGESVDGNNVWYQGTSGNWFWSGGFVEGANGTGLTNLNPTTPPPTTGTQRIVGPEGVKRRIGAPSTSAPAGEGLDAGVVGNFKGWINGENVGGNPVWFVGTSGDYFWSGGFTSTSRDGLADLNPSTPPVGGTQRTAGPGGVRRRSAPSTKALEAGELLAEGVVGNFNAWAKGEAVEGNDVWYRGVSGDWFWSGGFVGGANTAGLSEVPAPSIPGGGTDPDNPRNLPSYDPIYPGAAFGLVAPLGDGKRGMKGSGSSAVAVPVIIDRYIVHHTGTTADQLDYFSWKNGGGSCPTWYLRTSGQVIELIRPGMKPSATGAEWNWRSVAVETLNESGAPEWRVTAAQLEAHAQMIAWLASFDGKALDGVPVSFKIDREHVISDLETRETICPGPYLQGKLDDGSLVARAKAIYAEKYEPTDPGVPLPDRSVLEKLYDWLKALLGR